MVTIFTEASGQDASTISASKLNSVKAIVAAGYMSGASATTFAPKATLSANDAKAILTKITTSMVAPVQAMPKQGTTSPRRYVHGGQGLEHIVARFRADKPPASLRSRRLFFAIPDGPP